MPQEGKSPESKLGLIEYRGHTIAEKTAFAALIVFVGAAAAGAFGGGPASEAVATSADGKLRIHYQRFQRRDTVELLEISVPTIAGTNQVELTVNAEYLRRAHITEVFPQPMETTSHRFRLKTDGSGEPLEVRLYYEARLPGFMIGDISVARSGSEQPAQARIKQFVYP